MPGMENFDQNSAQHDDTNQGAGPKIEEVD